MFSQRARTRKSPHTRRKIRQQLPPLLPLDVLALRRALLIDAARNVRDIAPLAAAALRWISLTVGYGAQSPSLLHPLARILSMTQSLARDVRAHHIHERVDGLDGRGRRQQAGRGGNGKALTRPRDELLVIGAVVGYCGGTIPHQMRESLLEQLL